MNRAGRFSTNAAIPSAPSDEPAATSFQWLCTVLRNLTVGHDRGDHRLGRRLGQQRAGGEHAGQRSKPSIAICAIDDLVDQTDASCFVGGDQVSGEQHSLGHAWSEEVSRPLEGRRWIDDPELRRGDPEPGIGGGDAQIAVDGERTSAAYAVSGDERDRRLRQLGQRCLGDEVDLGERALARPACNGQLGDVGTGTEVLADAAQHDDSHRRISAELPRQLLETRPHRVAHRIAFARAGSARSWPSRRRRSLGSVLRATTLIAAQCGPSGDHSTGTVGFRGGGRVKPRHVAVAGVLLALAWSPVAEAMRAVRARPASSAMRPEQRRAPQTPSRNCSTPTHHPRPTRFNRRSKTSPPGSRR